MTNIDVLMIWACFLIAAVFFGALMWLSLESDTSHRNDFWKD